MKEDAAVITSHHLAQNEFKMHHFFLIKIVKEHFQTLSTDLYSIVDAINVRFMLSKSRILKIDSKSAKTGLNSAVGI